MSALKSYDSHEIKNQVSKLKSQRRSVRIGLSSCSSSLFAYEFIKMFSMWKPLNAQAIIKDSKGSNCDNFAVLLEHKFLWEETISNWVNPLYI